MKENFKNMINIEVNFINILSISFIALLFFSKFFNSIYIVGILTLFSLTYIWYQRYFLVNKNYLIFLIIVTLYIIGSFLNYFNRDDLIYDKNYILRQSLVFFAPLLFINFFKDISSNLLKNNKFYFLLFVTFCLIYFLINFIFKNEINLYILNGSLSLSIIGLVLITYYINSLKILENKKYKFLIAILILISTLIFTSTVQSIFFMLSIFLIYFFSEKYSRKLITYIFLFYVLLFLYSLTMLTFNPEYNYTSILIRGRFFFNDLYMILSSNLIGNGFGTYNIYINYDAPIRAIFDRPNIYNFFLINSHNMFTHIFQKCGIFAFIFFVLFFLHDLKPKNNNLNLKIDYTLWFILIISIFLNPSFYAVDNLIGLYFLISALSNKSNLLKVKF